MPNPTQIPSDRVDLIDPRTGLMARSWFLFFQSLNSVTNSSDDLLVGPVGSTVARDLSVQNSSEVLTWLSM